MSPSLVPYQRARGRVEVAFGQQDGSARLRRLYQSGSSKGFLPKTHGRPPEVVLVNTAGGVTGGDRIDQVISAGPGVRLVVTTQAAERVYRALAGAARIETRLAAGAGASLDWLPQETILFDGGHLARRLEVDLAVDATFTGLETLVLGRAAMGETLERGAIADQWRIRRDGRLIHAEALRIDGDFRAATAGSATLGGCRALATLIHAAPDAGDRLASARAGIAGLDAVRAAATAKAGVLILRLVAHDLAPLRAALVRFLSEFRTDPLPRVWSF
jgi:urease accessory protein